MFRNPTFIEKHMKAFALTNAATIHEYHHTFMRPLTPAPIAFRSCLNHFAALHCVLVVSVDEPQVGVNICEVGGNKTRIAHCKEIKVFRKLKVAKSRRIPSRELTPRRRWQSP